ncbi:TRAP transporter small permease [Alicyclobacillus sp.]|uniref:TRAP transporter small permease n=1 Tax=Alicyclobacillus sp. TaxID=61169 RepID=UPI0025BFBACD|nr:TRAP transporter small permease [Alicyclobacillus sp.]MCL6517435.1 TRAP transporter small permease [Alicyclobacillus sp.]
MRPMQEEMTADSTPKTRPPGPSLAHRALIAGMRVVLIILMVIMIFDVCWGVFTRYVLNQAATWTGELGGYTLAWITFLGSAWATFQKTHIRFETLIESLPRRIAVPIELVFNLITLVFLGVVAYYGFVLVGQSVGEVMETMPFSKAIVYVILPVSCVIMMIGYVAESVQMLRRRDT